MSNKDFSALFLTKELQGDLSLRGAGVGIAGRAAWNANRPAFMGQPCHLPAECGGSGKVVQSLSPFTCVHSVSLQAMGLFPGVCLLWRSVHSNPLPI